MIKIDMHIDDEVAESVAVGWLKYHYGLNDPEQHTLYNDAMECKMRRTAIEIILDYCGESCD